MVTDFGLEMYHAYEEMTMLQLKPGIALVRKDLQLGKLATALVIVIANYPHGQNGLIVMLIVAKKQQVCIKD